jgi:signal transduction histidine kinase/CheY-like chemotaxis protein
MNLDETGTGIPRAVPRRTESAPDPGPAEPRRLRGRHPWLPFVAGAAVALGTLGLWRALDVRAAEQTLETVEATTRGVQREVEERMEAMIRALGHLREHGRASQWRSPQDWQSHALLTLGAFPSFVAAHWTSATAERRTMAGDERWDPAVSEALITDPLFGRAVERATATGAPVVAGPFDHPGGPVFQVVLPPPEPAQPGAGYLAGAFLASRAFATLTSTVAPGYRVAVTSAGRRVFASEADGASRAALPWTVTLPLDLPGDLGWQVSVAPGAGLRATQRNRLPEAVLVAGLIIAVLLTLTLRYAELAEARARSSEDMVRRRTEELERALVELRQENRERRRTEITLRRFLITLGHELRNPLGSVTTALEVLDGSARDAESEERMRGIVRRQVGQLARLVDDLLDISRIEQGKVALRTERLDLAEVLRDVAESHRAEADAAGLALETELPGEAAWVEADATRLVQVVENLVSNAIKFTDPGGRVTVALERSGDELAVRVKDTGCGLAQDELEKVFEPFAQTDEAQRRMAGGLGLGLPIVKGLVEAHGGRLEAASPGPGRGAELTVRLPAAAPPAERAPEVLEVPAAGRSLRVLVIDDHEDSADGLAELLRTLGHEVDIAYDGATGVAAAVRDPPEVVISDLGLPEVDGYEVARRLRRHGATRDLHLIALSGYGGKATHERTREAGFDHHLTKPVDPATLRVLLDVPARPVGMARA